MENTQETMVNVSTDQLTEAVANAEKQVKKEEIKATQNTTTVQLPSNGLINNSVTHVTLRRMTTMEFKTLHTSKDPNYLTDLLLSCIVDPVNIKSTDLHPKDIIYLLFILRYISTPNKLIEGFRCPRCRQVFETNVDIQSLDVDYYNGDKNNIFTFELPESGDKLTFRILSEGDLINVERTSNRQINQFKLEGEDAEWHTLISKIAYQVTAKNDLEFEDFKSKVKYLESLSAYDFESFQNAYSDILESFGLNLDFYTTCEKCKEDVEVTAYIAPDFFRLV